MYKTIERAEDKEAAMAYRKQKEGEQGEQVKGQGYPACQLCGRIMQFEECSWQCDDGGLIYCQDCKAERESCGCSD